MNALTSALSERGLHDNKRETGATRKRGVRYAQYQVSHFARLRELFKTVWRANRSEEYDAKLWNESLTGVCPAVLAFWGEQIVGAYMIWPMQFSDGRQQVLGGQSIDSMVHPLFQGKGLLLELAARCYQLCYESQLAVMFGTPNRANYAGTVGEQNWCHVGNVVDFVRPLTPMTKKRWNVQESGWVCDTTNSELSGCVSKKDCSPDISLLDEKSGPAGSIWQVSRTPRWMDYRYRSAPDAEYYTIRLAGVRGRRGMAICGFRKSQAGVKATLVEMIAADEPSRRAVVRAAASWAQHKGARYLVAKSTNNNPNRQLFWGGFIPFRRTPLVVRTLSPKCYAANAYSSTAWDLFGGDFDTM